ncbi:MAG: DUF2520 domain-containing protein [Lachnospiraceae bacterium]|nr:DUF2520 domain-containing protein [Lachnospiraceae bacterium]
MEKSIFSRVGFIGAGKAGCSLGKYFSKKSSQGIGNDNVTVTGYYSLIEEEARWAAAFTETEMYNTPNEVVYANDSIIISTPDGAVNDVWNSLDKELIKDRIICHLSGSLSSDVFSGIENYGGYPISIHPLFAFSDKESAYRELNNVCFTLEGHTYAVSKWKKWLEAMGNETVEISKELKPKYHAAASVLSNHVIAVLDTGYKLLTECGFTDEQTRRFTATLVRDNVEHVTSYGTVNALTGPIERNDTGTVLKHLDVLDDEERQLYKMCGRRLLEIANKKNPDRDYNELSDILKGG